MTIANYLYALIDSDEYDNNKWQNWGENLLENVEYNPQTEWIFHLTFCSKKENVWEILFPKMLEEWYEKYNEYTLTEIIHGYYYLQYQEKKISLYDLLWKSRGVSVLYEDYFEDSIESAFLYDLSCQIDKNPDIIKDKEFQEIIQNFYTPLCQAALEQKKQVETCSLKDLIMKEEKMDFIFDIVVSKESIYELNIKEILVEWNGQIFSQDPRKFQFQSSLFFQECKNESYYKKILGKNLKEKDFLSFTLQGDSLRNLEFMVNRKDNLKKEDCEIIDLFYELYKKLDRFYILLLRDEECIDDIYHISDVEQAITIFLKSLSWISPKGIIISKG